MKKEIKELKRIVVCLNQELDSYNEELYKSKRIMVKMRSRITTLERWHIASTILL